MSILPTRRRLLRFITYLLVFGFVAVFTYTALNYQELKLLFEEEILLYGPYALFAGGFLFDAMAGPLGPEIPVTGGLIAGLDFITTLSTVILGSTLATLCIYSVSYHFGESWMLSHFSPERYDHWRDRFLKHRRLTVILGAATPVPYVVVCMIAGAFKMRFSEFALLAIGFRVLRITTAAYVVLLFQQSI